MPNYFILQNLFSTLQDFQHLIKTKTIWELFRHQGNGYLDHVVGPQCDEGKDHSVREIRHVRERTLCDRARLREKKGKKSSG